MADLKDKLKKLLGEQGLITGADLAARRELLPEPVSPASRLRDMLDHHGLARQPHRGEETGRRYVSDGPELEQLVPGEVIGEADDAFYLVRTEFPLDHRHGGGLPLGAALDAIPEHIALSACDPDLEGFDPATALFMDTETTGLAGGSGTVPFLVGVGYFAEGLFRLDQCFMRDYDDEAPMLRYLDGLFKGCETVVTYNGKSFDVPLLRTRFIANRRPFRLDAALHFDLVHASRRFWKRRLGDCSLGNVERTVLGLERHGDVPSAEIPQIWFDYLVSRDATLIQRVFYHHRMDILSLVALTGLLSRNLDAPEGEGFDYAEDRLSLVRLHFRQKRFEDVVRHARTLIETETAQDVLREGLELLAYAHKRLEQWDEMESAWVRLMQQYPKDLTPRLELAMHYEHRKRDLAAAERICAEVLEYLDTRSALGFHADLLSGHAENFRYRLDRIRRKRK